ncbi:uncharacterized protein LOC120534352 isoform X1 [Polypterus senegalus]|uniref:uncharacterized protein LOC120534352 isoform X1 n=1 Tax=Polypterus senegalus TaxID=55291 RepID=UPI0019666F9A|nr:uncharacterized protein LOC120534352 isoform X1 [Polypterus senegalus]
MRRTTEEQQEERAGPSNQQNEMAEQPGVDANAGGALNGAGGGGGGFGVGVSTGNYDNRTEYKFLEGGECIITCFASRHIHLDMPDTEQYTTQYMLSSNQELGNAPFTLQHDQSHQQVTTPWNYIDCNNWGIWLSPADMQHIANTFTNLEVLDLEQDIFNITIKTVTVTGTGATETKQFNNDLTATLQIAIDSNNILPFIANGMPLKGLGYYPWKAQKLPMYSYYTSFGAIPTAGSFPTHQGPQGTPFNINQYISYKTFMFMTIENTLPIEMLRTGDEWNAGKYTFDSKPYRLGRALQTQRHMGLPPINTKATRDHSQATIEQYNQYGYSGQLGNNLIEATRLRPYNIGFEFPDGIVLTAASGPALAKTVTGTQFNSTFNDSPIRVIFDYNHGADGQKDRYTLWNSEDIQGTCQAQNYQIKDGIMDHDHNATEPYITVNYAENTYQPNVCTDYFSLHYPDGQIWEKTPSTDLKEESYTATFQVRDNPPGKIFLKLTENLTDSYTPGGAYSRIITYATFFWKGKLTFKAKLRTPRSFNRTYVNCPDATDWNIFMRDEGIATESGKMRIVDKPVRTVPTMIY